MKDKTDLNITINIDVYCDMIVQIIKLKEKIRNLELKLNKSQALVKKYHKELTK